MEFAAQHLQIVHAAAGGPLRQNTGEALAAIREAGLASAKDLDALEAAWRVQQDLTQLLKVALEDNADPESEPKALKALLARAAGVRDFKALKARLAAVRKDARRAFGSVVN